MVIKKKPGRLSLADGPMRLTLSPTQGGAICEWNRGKISLLRPARSDADATTSVYDHAAYPLIPFSNRIANGQFNFGGIDYILPRNEYDTRHAMHGNALHATWDVTHAHSKNAVLHLSSTPTRQDLPFFPFSYDAEQSYNLTETSLRIDLRLQNTDSFCIPAGLGQHLCSPRRSKTLIKFLAGSMWENDSEGLPANRTRTWHRRMAEALMLDGTRFDNCFEEWNGNAEIIYPREGYCLKIEASSLFGHAVISSATSKNYFSFDPSTHMSNGINQPGPLVDTGLKILNPGETIEGWINLTVSPL